MYMHTRPATKDTSSRDITATAPAASGRKRGFAKQRLRGGKDRNNFAIVLVGEESEERDLEEENGDRNESDEE